MELLGSCLRMRLRSTMRPWQKAGETDAQSHLGAVAGALPRCELSGVDLGKSYQVAGVGAGDMLKLRIGVRNRFPDSDRSSERHRYSGPQLAADRGHPEGQSLYEAITRFQWVCTMGLLAGNLIAGLFASSNGTESRLRRSSGR